MRQLISIILTALIWVTPAFAEGFYTGRWVIAPQSGSPASVILDLFDDGRQVTGVGTILDLGDPRLRNGEMRVVSGGAVTGGLDLQLRLSGSAQGAVDMPGRLTARDSNGPMLPATLTFDGRVEFVVLENESGGGGGIVSPNPPSIDDPVNSADCSRLFVLLKEIDDFLEVYNASDNGRVDAIQRAFGLPTGFFPGEYTREACRDATFTLRDYFESELRPAVLANVAPSPHDDRIGIINVRPDGRWAPSSQGRSLTLWSHNGSLMAWEQGPGAADRRIWYWEPRQGLKNIGITRGVLLFEGRRDGMQMSGQARIFSRDCGGFEYSVSGPISANQERVTMYGTRPIISDFCNITGNRPDTLVFDFVALSPNGTGTGTGTAPPPSNEPLPDTPGIGVWGPSWRVVGVSAGDHLNLRTGGSTRFPIRARIPPGARGILVIGQGCDPNPDTFAFESQNRAGKAALISRSWCNVVWNGVEGWVYGRYLFPE